MKPCPECGAPAETTYSAIVRELAEARSVIDRHEKIKALVEQQASDEGCWFIPQTCAEDYLQQRLRELHAVIECTDIYGRKSTK